MLPRSDSIVLMINTAVGRDDVHWRRAMNKVRDMVNEDQERIALLRLEIDGYKARIARLETQRTP